MTELKNFTCLFTDPADAIDFWADSLFVCEQTTAEAKPAADFVMASIERRLEGTKEGDNIRTQNNEDQLALAMLEQNCENAMQQFRGLLKCSRCGSDKIFIRQKQSRAADEGMTLYCACKCGKSWKM